MSGSTNNNFVLPFSFYISFVIPTVNSIIYRLLNFKLTQFNFTPCHRALKREVIYLDQDELSRPGACFSSSDDFIHGLNNVSDYQHLRSHFSRRTLTPRIKKGFTDALRSAATCDINPDLVNAATFHAYMQLCRFLHIQVTNPANPEQCLSCGENFTTCKCYAFKFRYLQQLNCDCLFAEYGNCNCEYFPDVFRDLDVLRDYQDFVVPQILESLLGCPEHSDHDNICQWVIGMPFLEIQPDAGLRCHMSRCMERRVSENLPP